jgi:[acyl-carrier-protein] S-malonyltransferase
LVGQKQTNIAIFGLGHSLGEFSALTCSGALTLADAVRLVRQRGIFMQQAVPIGVGAMSAIAGASLDAIENTCREVSRNGHLVAISALNTPDQTVISGHKEAVSEAEAALVRAGARVVSLKVSAPFHCALMKPAAEKLREELSKCKFAPLRWPVIANVTARPYGGPAEIVENLTRQMIEPVRWVPSMQYAAEQGVSAVLEFGPGNVLRNMAKKTKSDWDCFASDSKPDASRMQAIIDSLGAGSAIHAGLAPAGVFGKKRFLGRCLAIAVATPNANANNEEYQIGVVDPYRQVQQLAETVEKESREPTVDEMRHGLAMLQSVFRTKKTPIDEQVERFEQIFHETATRELFPDFAMPQS